MYFHTQRRNRVRNRIIVSKSFLLIRSWQARRLHNRLLDPSNSRKSVRQLIALLHVLDCDLNLVVKDRKEAA